MCWVHANQDSALAARRDGHVAADEKGEAAEHLLLGQVGLPDDQFSYAIREDLVVGHAAIVTARKASRRTPPGGVTPTSAPALR